MSVLSKMALSTEEYLNEIYETTKKELMSQISYNDDMIYAKKLSAFLTQVKYMQKQFANTGSISAGSENFPFAEFWDKMSQINLMNELATINPEVFTQGTFIETFANQTNQSSQLGESLEIGVARLIRTFAAKISQTSYADTEGKIVSGVGERKTQIPNLNNVADKLIKQIFVDCYNEAREKMAASQKREFSGFQFQSVPSVQGKIDNVGLSANFVLSMQDSVSGIDKDILLALKDATFTDKNYVTTSHLKLGQTNPFRVFATVALGTGESIPDRYRRMVRCFENHESYHSKSPLYFYRIRAIYELTGTKMQYTNNAIRHNSAVKEIANGKAARFLIWNNPSSDIISVIPTIKIVNKFHEEALLMMPKNWKDALYGPIMIQQKGLLDLE